MTTPTTQEQEFKPRIYMRLPSKPLPRGGHALRGRYHQWNDDENNTINQNIINYNDNQNNKSNNEKLSNQIEKNSSNPLKIVYNGLKSFDEICCSTGMSCQQLDAYLARDKHVIVLLK